MKKPKLNDDEIVLSIKKIRIIGKWVEIWFHNFEEPPTRSIQKLRYDFSMDWAIFYNAAIMETEGLNRLFNSGFRNRRVILRKDPFSISGLVFSRFYPMKEIM